MHIASYSFTQTVKAITLLADVINYITFILYIQFKLEFHYKS